MMPFALRNIMVFYFHPYIFAIFSSLSFTRWFLDCNAFMKHLWLLHVNSAVYVGSTNWPQGVKEMYCTVQCNATQMCNEGGVLNR